VCFYTGQRVYKIIKNCVDGQTKEHTGHTAFNTEEFRQYKDLEVYRRYYYLNRESYYVHLQFPKCFGIVELYCMKD